MQRRIQLLAAVAAFALSTVCAAAAAQTPATPRVASGKPDLNGMWGGPSGVAPPPSFIEVLRSRRCAPTQVDCGEFTNQSRDGIFLNRLRPDRPLYKPEFWDRVQYLDMNSNTEDPLFICQPYGVPRIGPPRRIVQFDDKEVILFNQSGGTRAVPADYRVIPTDGRPHHPERSLDITFYGDSVGRWEGDVLVINSIGINDLTWMALGGYFTSDQKKTIERFWREGDTLFYQVTVDDPGVLVEPWVMPTIQVPLNKSPHAYLPEAEPCKEYDLEHMTTQHRH
jgi:hypothetical protein